MDNIQKSEKTSILDRIIRFFLEQKIFAVFLLLIIIVSGIIVAPFDFHVSWLPRNPIHVDAIPDIGENQQIVFTKWMGRSPKDIDDQITYPLTVSLLGIPGIKTIRSFSMFGFSTIYIIFDEDIKFYWSRSRILEKLNSLPQDLLPDGVRPGLGPDATALGQVFWYTLEGFDSKGKPTGGWDLDELRTIQDSYVKYSLMSAKGVSEVASVGGFVKEYQIEVDPDAMRAFHVKLSDVFSSIKNANKDVGARTIEINKAEYIIRGLGFIKNVSDIENTVIKLHDEIPIYVKNIANVTIGPALRRGVLDKEGAEVVGGVAVVRYGENPLQTISNIKAKIAEISVGLPSKTLSDGTQSKVAIVPFYDRSGLIYETLGTLNKALSEEILITILVVLIMIMVLRSSLLISAMVPLAVLFCFVAMKLFKIDANIVALSGIAIAIGTIVDVGIVISENILKHLEKASIDENRLEVIYKATKEVSGAVITAVATTVISFLPVFTMEAAEGKLFRPLAFTKTFALIGSIVFALAIIPAATHILFGKKSKDKKNFFNRKYLLPVMLFIIGIILLIFIKWWLGIIIIFVGAYNIFEKQITLKIKKILSTSLMVVISVFAAYQLSNHWLPLGPEKGNINNFIFVALLVGSILLFFRLFQYFYENILKVCLNHKIIFMIIPTILVLLGLMIWIGFNNIFSWLPDPLKNNKIYSSISNKFPGLGKEFMPPLDEGSFLYMPTTMPHASIGEVHDVLKIQDTAIRSIYEIDTVVGKLGRVESSLDPAPVSMIETVINYNPKYIVDKNGYRKTFKFFGDKLDLFRDINGSPVNAKDGEPYIVKGQFVRNNNNQLIEDKKGKPFRLWRPGLNPKLNVGRKAWKGIETPDDIWAEIVNVAQVPGTTSAPKLQPIAARIVMLQSGMRAPMGIKIKGPTLAIIDKVGRRLEKLLKEVPSVEPATVIADRVIGKPYLEIDINRQSIARYGIKLQTVQNVIEVAIGGKKVTTTFEGRERYPVIVRYFRELRDSLEEIENILVPAPGNKQIPLKLLSTINYVKGPQVIKSEDTFMVAYVLFDKKSGIAEVDAVENAKNYLNEKIKTGELKLPAGVSYIFAGNYENQIRSEKRLLFVLPLALFLIFIILYLQFKSVITTSLIFSGIIVAWAGGFIMIWAYSLPSFMDFSFLGTNMRQLFHIRTINLSVAIWVGFLALFGIASDDSVIMATYLKQIFKKEKPDTIKKIRELTIIAGKKRVRPCLMTTATTMLALIPVLTSVGRGSDIMVPMAIPSFGGMFIVIISMFVLPVLYCAVEELKFKMKG